MGGASRPLIACGGSGTGRYAQGGGRPGPSGPDRVPVPVRFRVVYTLAMAIHPDLLEILACPVCKTPVEVVKDGAGLRCGQCRRVYPVRDDIPIMLPEEATVEA